MDRSTQCMDNLATDTVQRYSMYGQFGLTMYRGTQCMDNLAIDNVQRYSMYGHYGYWRRTQCMYNLAITQRYSMYEQCTALYTFSPIVFQRTMQAISHGLVMADKLLESTIESLIELECWTQSNNWYDSSHFLSCPLIGFSLSRVLTWIALSKPT